LKATCQETAWVPLWDSATKDKYATYPPGYYCKCFSFSFSFFQLFLNNVKSYTHFSISFLLSLSFWHTFLFPREGTNVTGSTCLVLRMTVTAFNVEIGNVNIADSSGTFTERRKLGISPAIAAEGYHIRW
jgi:hypothetical protein